MHAHVLRENRMKMKNKGWRITAQVSRERAGKSCNQRQGYPIIIKGISRFYMW